jgi:hypothetical protein
MLMRAYDEVLDRQRWPPVLLTPFSAATLSDFLRTLGAPADVMQTASQSGKNRLEQHADCKFVLAQSVGALGGKKGADKVDVDMAIQGVLYSCGVQMPPNMPKVDHMLVFTRFDDRPVDKDNLLVLFTRTKNRISLGSKAAVPYDIFEPFTSQGVPVVHIRHVFSLEKPDTPFSFEAKVRLSLLSVAST